MLLILTIYKLMINQSQEQYQEIKKNTLIVLNKNKEIINTKGIHNPLQLMLVAILIMLSTASVIILHKEKYLHSRYMRTYCNLYILGNNDMSLYEDGLNIDQQDAQFSLIQDMKKHLLEILNITQSIKTQNLAQFQIVENATLINIESIFLNKTINITQFTSISQAINFLHIFQIDEFKNYLLNTYAFKINVYLGDNKFVQDYVLTARYRIHSFLMLDVSLEHQFTLKGEKSIKITNIRILQRIMALFLLIIYLYKFCLIINDHQQLVSQYQPIMKHIQIQKISIKYRNWHIFLILMSLIIIFNETYAPMCSFLQLLPIFQFPQRQEEAKEQQIYNFNKNLRFSLPLIATIFFQVLIVLNGLVFLSILIYPGDYFDDYFRGFFSYFYQFFQVGTYEIFTQIKHYGKGAYLLYGIMYFYIFLVGNSLIPALFVILIQMKITQKDIRKYTINLIENCVCPNCLQKNPKYLKKNIQITVLSPNLSPLITRNKLKSNFKQRQQNKNEKLMMIYIGDQMPNKQSLIDNKQYELNQIMIALSSKINLQTRTLSQIILLLNQMQELQIALELIQELKSKIYF